MRMDEWLTILATLLGAVIGGIIGFAGAYLVERQRFKKERVIEMRDRIYGPMLMETSRILEVVTLFQSSYYNAQENLKKLGDDYLFFTLEQDLKSRFAMVIDRLEKYQTVRHAAEIKLNEDAHQEIIESSGHNIGVSSVFLNMVLGETMAATLDLQTSIFLKTTPQDFIKKEKEKWSEDLQVDARFAGAKTTLEDFEFLYNSILTKMENEPLYQMEKEQRTRLTKELENLIEQIKPFVKPK
jgi:hypothetical protein